MFQIKDFHPTQGLQPYPKSSAFGEIPRTFHPRIHDGDRPLQQQQQHNPIEVAVTLCSHELEIDEDGVISPKEERVISLFVPEFTRKAVTTAFEQFKQQFLGFYILDFNRCYTDAEF